MTEPTLEQIEARLALQRDASPDDRPSRAELRADIAYLLNRVKSAETALSIADRTPDAFTLTAQKVKAELRARIAESEVVALREALRELDDAWMAYTRTRSMERLQAARALLNPEGES